MTRVLRDQWAPMAIAAASLVALVWLEALFGESAGQSEEQRA